jgi:hypothetical protein
LKLNVAIKEEKVIVDNKEKSYVNGESSNDDDDDDEDESEDSDHGAAVEIRCANCVQKRVDIEESSDSESSTEDESSSSVRTPPSTTLKGVKDAESAVTTFAQGDFQVVDKVMLDRMTSSEDFIVDSMSPNNHNTSPRYATSNFSPVINSPFSVTVHQALSVKDTFHESQKGMIQDMVIKKALSRVHLKSRRKTDIRLSTDNSMSEVVFDESASSLRSVTASSPRYHNRDAAMNVLVDRLVKKKNNARNIPLPDGSMGLSEDNETSMDAKSKHDSNETLRSQMTNLVVQRELHSRGNELEAHLAKEKMRSNERLMKRLKNRVTERNMDETSSIEEGYVG